MMRQRIIGQDRVPRPMSENTPETTDLRDSIHVKLSESEMAMIRAMGTVAKFADGDKVFCAGDAELDLYVVESGAIEIQNPSDANQIIAVHGPNGFAGDIDLLTGRPVIVSGVACGDTTLLVIPFSQVRSLLNRVPSFGEKLIGAFTQRRDRLALGGKLGLQVVGHGHCKDTNLVREFLYKNFVPFTWLEPASQAGQRIIQESQSKRSPIVYFGDGSHLIEPTLTELAKRTGVLQACPQTRIQLAIIGAGPAGIAAAVYAASEGIATLLIDRLGPGGQAGGSSKIENFIGFPAGLSGTELATRGVLQMLKFGAKLAAPVSVKQIVAPESPAQSIELHCDCGTIVRADVVLIATGVHWRRLAADVGGRFASAGVHYVCTAVEAHLYDNEDVAVVGGGNSAGQAVMYLAECCRSRTVHLMVRSAFGKGMSEYLAQRIRSTPNVRIYEQMEVSAIRGERRIESLTLRHVETQVETPLACRAVFAFIGAEPSSAWLPTTMARDGQGYVVTGSEVLRSGKWPLADRDPCPLETSIPGVLAAGDIRSGSTKRVGFAVGDGSLAVTCTHRLLSLLASATN